MRTTNLHAVLKFILDYYFKAFPKKYFISVFFSSEFPCVFCKCLMDILSDQRPILILHSKSQITLLFGLIW